MTVHEAPPKDRSKLLRRLRISSDISLALYCFFLPWPHTAALKATLFGVAVILGIVSAAMGKRRRWHRTSLDLLILGMVLSVIVSSWLSIKPEYSFKQLESELFWQLGLFYVIVLTITEPKRLYPLILAIFLSLAVISVYGIVGYAQQVNLKVDGIVGARATSFFPSYERAAFYVSLIFPLMLAYFFVETRRRYLWPIGYLIGGCLVFLVLTYTRGSWLSIGIIIVIVAWLKDRKILIALGIVIILSPLFMPEKVLQRGATFFYMRYFKTLAISGDRYWLWLGALTMIKDHPFFGLGYGTNIFHLAYPGYVVADAPGEILESAHNFYLQVAVERGIVGFLWLMSIFVKVVVDGIKGLKRLQDHRLQGILLGAILSLVVFFSYGMTTYRYENEIGILVWIIMAIIVILCRSAAVGGSHAWKR